MRKAESHTVRLCILPCTPEQRELTRSQNAPDRRKTHNAQG